MSLLLALLMLLKVGLWILILFLLLVHLMEPMSLLLAPSGCPLLNYSVSCLFGRLPHPSMLHKTGIIATRTIVCSNEATVSHKAEHQLQPCLAKAGTLCLQCKEHQHV